MDSYPKMFCIFIAKQVLGWCGLNSKQSLWDTSINNICPNCGMLNETSNHMTQGKDPGRLDLLWESIDNILTHLEKANAPIPLIEMIEAYLLSQRSQTLESCNESNDTQYTTLAHSYNCLGWDSFIEGQISIFWLNLSIL